MLFGFIGRLLRQALMILLLSGLERLALLHLLCLELLLLLLISLIRLGVACVWRRSLFRWRNIPGMH